MRACRRGADPSVLGDQVAVSTIMASVSFGRILCRVAKRPMMSWTLSTNSGEEAYDVADPVHEQRIAD